MLTVKSLVVENNNDLVLQCSTLLDIVNSYLFSNVNEFREQNSDAHN